LDLRNNGGGALEDAVKIAGLFIDYGPIVQVRDRANRGYTYEDTDPTVVFDGTLVVLTNVFSASASEIVAAALQDYGRAVILGSTHTYGKGTVQNVLNLDAGWGRLSMSDQNSLGSVEVTNQKYYRVTGGSTQFKGVMPDIVAPDANDYLDVGERSLKHPLPWSTTTSANIQKWARPIPLR
jgi:carboxyl-terminal processing protease